MESALTISARLSRALCASFCRIPDALLEMYMSFPPLRQPVRNGCDLTTGRTHRTSKHSDHSSGGSGDLHALVDHPDVFVLLIADLILSWSRCRLGRPGGRACCALMTRNRAERILKPESNVPPDPDSNLTWYGIYWMFLVSVRSVLRVRRKKITVIGLRSWKLLVKNGRSTSTPNQFTMVRAPNVRHTKRGTTSSSRFDSENDVVCHWVVVGQNPLNKLARLDPQGLGPNQVTVRRDTALPVLELRNESVIFGPHHFGQLALGQTALLSQLAQPMSSFIT